MSNSETHQSAHPLPVGRAVSRPSAVRRGNARAQTRGIGRWVHVVGINLLLICDLLFTSRLYRVGEIAIVQPLVLGAIAALILAYAGYCLIKGYLIPILYFALFVFLIVHQLLTFTTFTGAPLLINSAFQLVTILSFVAFYAVAKAGMSEYLMRTVLRYAVGYCIIYLVLAIGFSINVVPRTLLAPLIATDVERGDRVFLYMAPATLAWFATLYRFRTQRTWVNFCLMAVCILTILIALSRVYGLFIVLVTALYIAGAANRVIKLACLSILVVVSLVYFYGMVDTHWNPFAMVSADSSGGARALEFETARYFVQQSPIWGIGFPPTSHDTGILTGNDYFAAADLGSFGVWYDWGLIGVVAYFIGSYLVCLPVVSLPPQLQRPAVLTACVMAGYGCMAPVIFYPGGATYFALFLGLVLAERTGAASPKVTSRWRRQRHAQAAKLSEASS